MPSKAERRAAIRERAADAIRDMYHNATPRYPHVDDDAAEAFQAWFDDSAVFEIKYISDGGAYGRNFRKTLEANAARKYKSAAARDYYVRKGMRDMRAERARCNDLDSRRALTNAAWERIAEFGKLYTYGRGGRTLAPSDLVRTGGGSSFGMREDYFDDSPIADVVDAIRVLESFNRYVAAWCKSIPELWREYFAENYGGECLEETAELLTTD